MGENNITNKVGSLALILMLVCAGFGMIVTSSLMLGGVEAASEGTQTSVVDSNILPINMSTLSSNIDNPINNSVMNSLTNISGNANDSGGSGVKLVEITLEDTSTSLFWNGFNWSISKTWVKVSGTNIWAYDTSSIIWSLGVKYRVQSRATDNLNNIETPSWGTVFYISTQPINVTSSIDVPANNSYVNSLNSISGSATPSINTSVQKVEISINKYTTSNYWDGTGWTSGVSWLNATGNTSWSYNSGSVTWSSNSKYHIRSRATDDKSSVETPSFGNIFTFDDIKPSSSITSPANNSVLSTIDKITGIASDTGGAGIDYVKISIRQSSSGKYYDGCYWVPTPKWLMTSGTTNWFYNIITNQTWSPGAYHVKSMAVDKANNQESPSFGNLFTIQAGPNNLLSTINVPANNSCRNALTSITGNAYATGGLSVNKVEISIKDTGTSNYWSGSGWTSSLKWLLVSGTAPWSYNSGSVTWVSGNQYLGRSKTTHNATVVENPGFGNKFIFDTANPSSLISYPGNNTNLKILYNINGSAGDIGGAGINNVKICLKRCSDSKYYYGGSNTSWYSSSVWLSAYGKTTWTYNVITNTTWQSGKYHVQSRAMDNTGNVENPSFGIIFYINKSPTKPSSTITSLTNNAFLNVLNTISGTATDNRDSAVKQVEISIQQTGDDFYWHGSNWEKDEYWLLATGTESWSYDSSGVVWSSDNHYNIRSRAIDNADNVEVPGAGITYMFDNKPPQNLGIKINNGAKYTRSRLVTLSLSAQDSGSDISQIALSPDGTKWSSWEPFNNTISFELPTGDGEKIVHFKVSDRASNIAITTDTIILDSTPPHSLSISINNGATETISPSVSLNLNAFDDTSGVQKMAFSTDGFNWTSWEAFNQESSYTLLSEDGEMTIYFKVMDIAGNIAEPVYASIRLNTIVPVKDTDNDGYNDDNDAFANDHAASVDSDGDGSPDQWNPGKSEADSTTGLHLDSFPLDHAASVDSDKDGYPDCWNIGKSQKDSVLNLQLDEYPDDPNRHIKTTSATENLEFFPMIILFIVVITIMIMLSAIFRNKRQRRNDQQKFPKKQNEVLKKVKHEIIHDSNPKYSELSDEELKSKLEERFSRGEISRDTYQYLKEYDYNIKP